MQYRVGFIGLGIMGLSMARNLLRAGHRVRVWNRTAGRAEALVSEGADDSPSAEGCGRERDVVISVVTDGPDVEEVLLGRAGAAASAAPGTVFIDMSTIAPEAARSIAGTLEARGLRFLDAPVSGGDIGARDGTLTIMVGGDPEVFEKVRPLLLGMGKRVTLLGPVGSGQVAKAANQILCALNLLGVCEALALVRESGLDPEAVRQVLTGGAANSWSLEQLGRRINEGDYRPGFMVKLLSKDLGIVLDEARNLRLPLAGTALCEQLFRSSVAHGDGDLGTQALFKVLARLGGFSPPEA